MNTIKSKLTLILLSFVIFYSCKKEDKSSDKSSNLKNLQTDIKDNTIKGRKTTTLFSFNTTENTEIVKISGSEVSEDDNFLLVGDKNILLVTKYKKNKPQQLIQSDTLLISDYNHVTIDRQLFLRKKINNADYFLFALMESPLGNGDHSLYLSFIMLNLNTLKYYTLKYEGEPTLRSDNAVDGNFLENTELDHNTAIKNELYRFANKSKWIYSPSEEEKDINFYKNFEQKWYEDNYTEDGKSSYPAVVKSTYYSEDLFQFNGRGNDDGAIENADFKIVPYFRHNLIGYDKNKRLYFPIKVESCAHGCAKTIEFLSEHEIEVSYEMNVQQPDTIDLNKIIFTNRP
ncbi:hypothetical protein [Flavobacterium tructae]|uniref:Uncharacterized protein n=1 Tax=Flavobacterium tructae TaxID=1114873 RepID=A0A1S1J361_9FLAO|nr:hypothetical protein [Flavobacterium tructae]OHT44220.1 hypothetical protein BHE19_14975 [Flavobacterium tructae]OXB20132.1 hypothetical protein B0A71_08750 [Flavobacterium tructae]